MVGCVWVVLSLSFLPVFGEQKCAEGFYEQNFGHHEHCYRIIAYEEAALQSGKNQLEAGDERCKNFTNHTTDQSVVPRLLSVGSEEELRFVATLFLQARESLCSAVQCAESLPLGVLSSSGNGSVASFSSLDESDVAFLERRFSETSIPAGKCIFYTPPHGIDMANCSGEQQTPNGGSGNSSKSASTRILFAGCKYPLVGKRKPIRLRAGKVAAPKPVKETTGIVADLSRDKFSSDDGGPKAGAKELKKLGNKKPNGVKQDGDKSMTKVQTSAVKTDGSGKMKVVTTKPKTNEDIKITTPATTASTTKPSSKEEGKTAPSATTASTTKPRSKEEGKTPPSATTVSTKKPRSKEEGKTTSSAVTVSTTKPRSKEEGKTTPSATTVSTTKPRSKEEGKTAPSATTASTTKPRSKEESKTTPLATTASTTKPTTKETAILKATKPSAVKPVGSSSSPKLSTNNIAIVSEYRSLDAADENFLDVNDGPVAPLPNPPRMTKSDRKKKKGVRAVPVSLFSALVVVLPFIFHPTQ